MGGIGGLVAEHPAGHDHVDRRLDGLHHPDLHGRRVGAQDGAARCAVVHVERVVHAPRRVLRRHVQRLEVVPVGLHLRALGDLEAEPDEHVLQALPGLGDDVCVPAGRAAHHLGEVQPLGGQLGGPLGALHFAAAGGGRSLHRRGGLVDRLAGGLLLVHRGQRPEAGLERGERALLAQQVGGDGIGVRQVGDGRQARECAVAGGQDLVDHRFLFTGWSSSRAGSPGRSTGSRDSADQRATPSIARGHRNRCDHIAAELTRHSPGGTSVCRARVTGGAAGGPLRRPAPWPPSPRSGSRPARPGGSTPSRPRRRRRPRRAPRCRPRLPPAR